METLNGTNYDEWKESLEIYLAIAQLDLALRVDKPTDLTLASSAAEKTFHEKWHNSNRLCLMVIKFTIDEIIRHGIPEKDTAVEFLKEVEEKFKKFDKAQKSHYLSLLDSTHYHGDSGVCEHIMKLVNYFNKLKSLGVDLGEFYLVWKILESLPPQFQVLKTIYYTLQEEWSVDQLIAILTLEEESLKKEKYVSHESSRNMHPSFQKGKKPKFYFQNKKDDSKRKLDPLLGIVSPTCPTPAFQHRMVLKSPTLCWGTTPKRGFRFWRDGKYEGRMALKKKGFRRKCNY